MLHIAAQRGYPNIVSFLLDEGANIGMKKLLKLF